MSGKLVLVRHGQSVWNVENLFTGWMDVDLSAVVCEEAQQAGRDSLAKQGVTMVDVDKDEAAKTREKMLADQDKVAADAHMSPDLIKLVMTDVAAA